MATIANCIAQDSPARATTFVQELREKTNVLADFPAVGRAGRVAGTRELVGQLSAESSVALGLNAENGNSREYRLSGYSPNEIVVSR